MEEESYAFNDVVIEDADIDQKIKEIDETLESKEILGELIPGSLLLEKSSLYYKKRDLPKALKNLELAIKNFEEETKPRRWQSFTFEAEPLTPYDIILPSLGVIIVCISTYLIAGLLIVYIKIFLKTSSKYIAGLLFFLTPLFIQSIFSVNTLRSLFVSSAIPFPHIRESIGFGIGGLGGILVILSIFEIIGLSILLYLSTE